MVVERIAFATQGSGGLDDIVSPVFGRCPTFTIVEIEDGQIKNVTVQQNPAMNAIGGAGIQAAQIIASLGATAVVAGSFGPNATNALMSLGIRTIPGVAGITVRDAVNQYISGQLGAPTGMPPQPIYSSAMPPVSYPSTYPSTAPVSGPTLDKETEIRILKLQKEMIEKQIELIKKRLEELK
ncbi:MAG: NifB/NifX family molybdenum-iron cluster-binding protein [Candidatus Asgardarchaeia archaeon]